MRPEAEALTPDPRFATTVALKPNGTVRPITFADHYGLVASLDTITGSPHPCAPPFSARSIAFSIHGSTMR